MAPMKRVAEEVCGGIDGEASRLLCDRKTFIISSIIRRSFAVYTGFSFTR